MYADDIALVVHSKSLKNNSILLEADLQKINHWLKNNNLSLNTSKTKFMEFTINKKTSTTNSMLLYIHNISCQPQVCKCPTIEKVKEMRYLGLLFDEHLKWIPHINLLSKKLIQKLHILFKINYQLSFAAKKTIFYSLIQSTYQYALPVWGGAYPSHKKILDKTINKIQQITLSCQNPLPLNRPILNLSQLYAYRSCLYYFLHNQN
jgi:hypothetical protein